MLTFIEKFGIKSLPNSDFTFIPIIYLIKHISTHDLYEVWMHLPEGYQQNPKLLHRLPCFEHYNNNGPNCVTEYEGAAPSRKNCIQCSLRLAYRRQNFVIYVYLFLNGGCRKGCLLIRRKSTKCKQILI